MRTTDRMAGHLARDRKNRSSRPPDKGGSRVPVKIDSIQKWKSQMARREHGIVTMHGIGTRVENQAESKKQNRKIWLSVTCRHFLNGRDIVERHSRKPPTVLAQRVCAEIQ
jgi:hypothetical protein